MRNKLILVVAPLQEALSGMILGILQDCAGGDESIMDLS